MKKKILHLTFDMRIGGAEQVIKNLIEGADTDLFEMSIFCIEEPIGPFGQVMIGRGTEVSSYPRNSGFDFRLVKVIRRHIKRHKIDVLHCHQYTPWVYGALAAAFTAVKVVFTEHGRFYPDTSNWKRKVANPWLVRLTPAITAISKATRQALVDFEYIPERKISVIYNGIHALEENSEETENLRAAMAIKEETVVLGTVARLDPIKNHKMMIVAFHRVLQHYPNTILIICGDGDERPNLEKLIKDLGIADKVFLPGYQPNPENYLALMDIYLLSSFSEGTSMTLLEAMSLSKPCVVTDAGGNPEIIIDGRNGLVTGNDDPEEFSAAIVKLIQDTGLRSELSHEAGVRFQEKFTARDMCKNYQSVYL